MSSSAVANPFTGTPISPSPLLDEFHITPRKVVKVKKWMCIKGGVVEGRCYRQRVQKKWNKRYGVTKNFVVINIHGELFAHPKTIERIKAQLENNHANDLRRPRQ